MPRFSIPCGLVGLLALSTSAFSQSGPYTGLVEPFRDVLLSSAVPGRIAAIHAMEGERVAEGMGLLELESRLEELEVDRRRAIFEDKSELEAARERHALLKDELASTKALAERTGSVSRDEVNRKQLETLLARLEVSRLEQSELREGIELEMATERLTLQKIAAPFTGVLAQLPLDVGESVQVNQPVIRLVDDQKGFLILNVPASVARSLHVDDPVRLSFHLIDPVEKEGTVAFISPVVDPASGLRKVKMLFDNREPKIEPGVSGQWMPAHE